MRDARIRLTVQHRHTLTRDALATALREVPDVDVRHEVSSLAAAATVCREHPPDVAVLEIGDDLEAGFAEIASVSAASGATRIICVVDAIDPAGIAAAEGAGVDHLVSTTMGLPTLIEAVRHSHDMAVKHFVHVTRVKDSRADRALTARELEVLEWVAAGQSRVGIAEALGISVKTVDTHKRNLVVKLGATNQAHAVSIAVKRGLLRRPDSASPKPILGA